MISRSEALSIAQAYIDRSEYTDTRRFVVTRVQERRRSWVIYYDSQKHVETGSLLDAIAGNGPLIVGKDTGQIAVAGTAAPLADRILEAENSLGFGTR
jgi:hypothetical protein